MGRFFRLTESFFGKEVVGGAKSRAATAAAIQDTGHRAVVWWTGFVEDRGGGELMNAAAKSGH